MGAFLGKVVTGRSLVMAWSWPDFPVAASHGKSISFELSPSISTAIGAPMVAAGSTESPEHHGLLHSPLGPDLLEKVRARKQVAEAIRVIQLPGCSGGGPL